MLAHSSFLLINVIIKYKVQITAERQKPMKYKMSTPSAVLSSNSLNDEQLGRQVLFSW